MKFKILLLALFVWGIQTKMSAQTKPKFYLHENGVTCMCPNAAIGETGIVNGVVYTKRTRDQIAELNAATTCTSGITDMSNLFKDKSTFNKNISSWDVSNVTNMSRMFSRAISFNQPIGNWNVSNVTNMADMFNGALKFNQPLGNWNVSKVTNMSTMFSRAISFNQPIGNWNVSNVTDMSEMFAGASIFNQPIGNWEVSKVTNMRFMINIAEAFNQPIGNWNVSNVTDMGGMFSGATSFNQPIDNWNVSNVTDMRGMFHSTSSFNQNLNNWCVSKIVTEPTEFSINSPLSNLYKPLWGKTCLSLSNNEFSELENETSVLPNPFTDITNVVLPFNIQLKNIEVFNTVGQTVKITLSTSLDLQHLPNGVYYLKINTDKGAINKKVVKN